MPSRPNDKTDTKALPIGAVRRQVERHRGGVTSRVGDAVAEELPVALIYNERPHAVMMATPVDLEDFAIGFSLSEGIIANVDEFRSVRIGPALAGIEIHISIPDERAAVLEQRVRQLTGRTGCGLCGAQTLDAAVRHPAPVKEPATFTEIAIQRAISELQSRQTINIATGATHAAAWVLPNGFVEIVREDVGRHNALDKLVGAMTRNGSDVRQGFMLVTSRGSYEMVMKAATVGIGVLVAISAPTALAIALANETNVTLIGFARADGYSVYANGHRLIEETPNVKGAVA
ncbi:MAG TPA: formate dehydrogenase accessory sulfurtransferase FdhD [Rudaea sp.]|jgi:FdhD protein|nr:formate dehydrogenase accessory sulfurtransferase FdhD [Rudaea sp.]